MPFPFHHARIVAAGLAAALLATACGGDAETTASAAPPATSVDWPDHVGTQPAEAANAADLCAAIEPTVLEVVPDAGPAEPDEYTESGERVLTCLFRGDVRSIVVTVSTDPTAWAALTEGMPTFGTFRGQPGVLRQAGAYLVVRAHNGWTVEVTNLTPERDNAVSGIVAEATLDALDPYGSPVADAAPGTEFDRTLATSVVDDAPPVAEPGDDPSWAQAVCEAIDPSPLAPFFAADVPSLEVEVGMDAGAPVGCRFATQEREVEIVVHWASTLPDTYPSARALDVDGHTGFLGEVGLSEGVENWLHLQLTRDVQGLEVHLTGFTPADAPTDEHWRELARSLLAAWEAA